MICPDYQGALMALDPTDQAMVDKLEAKVAPLLAEVGKLRGFINTVYELAGEAIPYPDAAAAALASPSPVGRKSYARDAFYGMGLATAVRKLLEENGALSAEEIRDLLFSGGFKFEVEDVAKQLNNLKISLGKNQVFDRTSKGDYTIAVPRARRKGGQPRGASMADDAPAEVADEATSDDSNPFL
jgi:hypothetical protein